MKGLRQHLPSDEAVPGTAGDAEEDATASEKGKSADRDLVTRGIVSARPGLSHDPDREKHADRDAATAAGDGRRAGDLARTVTVTASQSFAPPASLPMSRTAAALVAAIGADSGFRQAMANAMLPGTVAAPAHLLKIELHPAELGSVAASLRLSGEQLSVELKPESHEAYRRLSADADEIRKSLDRLGLSVDTVTVLQPQIAASAATRADMTASSTAAPGQNQPSFQSGGSGKNGDGPGGQQPGGNRNDGRQDSPYGAPTSRIRSGDLFI
jgi:chemotaxis protein MotD